jgi:hypothetical protein
MKVKPALSRQRLAAIRLHADEDQVTWVTPRRLLAVSRRRVHGARANRSPPLVRAIVERRLARVIGVTRLFDLPIEWNQ